MKQAFFIAGTDTGVGKTVVSAGLLTAANQHHWRTVAMKPVAAGCRPTAAGLRNDDAVCLQRMMSMAIPYEQINPVALASAIAPHIAAEMSHRSLSVASLLDHCQQVLQYDADVTVIEGAGGWRVPLNATETMADLVRALQVPVILVVAMRLGCLNHALLTAEAMLRDGVVLAGWVANGLGEPMPHYHDNVASLAARLPAPCLGELPCLPTLDFAKVADSLDWSRLWLRVSPDNGPVA